MIPAKAHYACLAVAELALRSAQNRPVCLREITQTHAIPHPFLVQIVQQLKVAGLVASTRGSQGGYRLTRKPEEVTLRDVIEAVGGEVVEADASDDTSWVASQVNRAWTAAAAAHREVLTQTRISDLIKQPDLAPMFHI